MIIRNPNKVQPTVRSELDRNGVLAKGLALLLPLSRNSDVFDLVSGGKGTATGLNTLGVSSFGTAPIFGTSNYFDFLQPSTITTDTQPVTFAWVQEPRAHAAYSTLLTWRPSGATNPFLIYQSITDSSYYFTVGPRAGAAVPNFSATTGAVQNNKLDYYVLVCAGGLGSTTASQYTLFRNGVRITTSATSSFGSSTATVARIGATEANGDPFEGLICNVHIWSRALTDQEARESLAIV